jgi:hypothetical protein
MTMTRKQHALIAVARKKLDMGEAEDRATLASLCGVASATELDGEGFDALMGYFGWRGFVPGRTRGPDYGRRPGMASFAQLELIRVLWEKYSHGRAGAAELDKWLLRSLKVSSPRFLTLDAARRAITALKSMKARAARSVGGPCARAAGRPAARAVFRGRGPAPQRRGAAR